VDSILVSVTPLCATLELISVSSDTGQLFELEGNEQNGHMSVYHEF
jgi:hypothetical protein